MILGTQNSQNYGKRKATIFLGTQNQLNYGKREATRFRPAGFSVFSGFCVR